MACFLDVFGFGTIRANKDSRAKYVIFNRQIANCSAAGHAADWEIRLYTGGNPHNHPIHISVRADKPHYDGDSDWTLQTPLA